MCHQADVSQMMAERVTKRLPDDSLAKMLNEISLASPHSVRALTTIMFGETHP